MYNQKPPGSCLINGPYENNYLDARKQMNKAVAEQLFPTLNTISQPNKTAVEDSQTN